MTTSSKEPERFTVGEMQGAHGLLYDGKVLAAFGPSEASLAAAQLVAHDMNRFPALEKDRDRLRAALEGMVSFYGRPKWGSDMKSVQAAQEAHDAATAALEASGKLGA